MPKLMWSGYLARLFSASPLRQGRFRNYYFGTVSTAFGYTMQATVAAWVMASLTPSALMVGLVQTASTIPALVFGLVGGAVADIVSRRRVLLATHMLLLATTLALGVTTLTATITPILLLALTVLIGLGFSFYQPAQQAVVNDLVSREDLSSAIGLSAVGFNVARAAGPALAGVIIAWLGSGIAFIASALCFVGMMLVVHRWSSSAPSFPGIAETVFSGIRSGLRYARHAPAMHAFLLRNFMFCICGSSLMALLPVITRDQLGLGAGGFGLLYSSFGVGAMFGAVGMSSAGRRISLNTTVNSAMLLWAAGALQIASATWVGVAMMGAFAAGAAWVAVLSSLFAGILSWSPGWVRARTVALNLLAVQAGLALGSGIWGWLASLTGSGIAMASAASLLLLALALSYRVRVAFGNEADVSTEVLLPDLAIDIEPQPDDGPVLIQCEYLIPPENCKKFLKAIRSIERIQRRNGASDWHIFRDLESEGRFVERFVVNSWAEYTRLRARFTVVDQELQDQVVRLQMPGIPLQVSRLIAVSADYADSWASKAGGLE